MYRKKAISYKWLAAHHVLHDFTQLEIPLPATLFKSIECLEEHAMEQLAIFGALLIALWWLHVDLLLKVAIQEGSVNGVTLKIISCNKCRESTHK